MKSRLYRSIMTGLVILSGIAVTGWAGVAQAQGPSVLRVARGLASENINVLVNRAIVVESSQPFLEVSVAQPEIADVSPLSDRAVYIFGRNRGTTTLTLLGENGALITNVTITVSPDLGELKHRLRAMMPKEPIQVRAAGSGIVLSGVVSGKAKIDKAMALARAYSGENVTNMMSVGGTQQVSLKVRIAEMTRSAGKELGISTGLVGRNGRASPFVQTGEAITNNLGDGSFFGGAAPQFENVLSSFGVFGALFSIADNYLLDLQIDALEQKGYARLLAEPNLVALSGAEANFLAGGEVPIPVIDSDGDVDIEYKPIGVNLNFRPTVLDNDLVNISVSAEVSAIDPTNDFLVGVGFDGLPIAIPAFDVRRAETVVELRDGQSFAIAGLFQDDFRDTVDQVPWLGDVPILGTLFRSTQFQSEETELVIIVSVDLVVPVDSIEQLELPTDRIAIPNESELFLFGRTEAPGAMAGGAAQAFDGSFGYVVE